VYFQTLDAPAQISGDGLAIARASEPGVRADYARALRRAHTDMPLSARAGAAYQELQESRRHDLEVLLRTGFPTESLGTARDLICAICEESAWSENPETPFEDDMHPTIDRKAAQTACLLGWAKASGQLDARTVSRMLFEARRRIFTPMIAHSDYQCLTGDAPYSLAILTESMAAALLLEADGARFQAFMRRAARAADALIDRAAATPILQSLTDRAAATALGALAQRAAARTALGRALPKHEWLDELLMAHLGGEMFIDPAGAGTRKGLNGADVYLMGELADDDALCALGAQLYRAQLADASAVSARMLFDLPGKLRAATGAAPRLKHAATPDASILSARGGGMHVILHAGGNGNAGGVYAAIEGRAALVPYAGDAPVINGARQAQGLGQGDYLFGEARADLSMDMTRLYAAGGVRFYQRTVMLDRVAGAARIVDMLESEGAGAIRYAFASPCLPTEIEGGVQIGLALFRWEGAPMVSIRRAPGIGAFTDELYFIGLEYPANPGSNLYHFMVERA
jgi:hypothetical protein